jgi:hypothetical protein
LEQAQGGEQRTDGPAGQDGQVDSAPLNAPSTPDSSITGK